MTNDPEREGAEVAACLNLHLNAGQEKSASVRTESDPSADGTSGRVLAPSPVPAPSAASGLAEIRQAVNEALSQSEGTDLREYLKDIRKLLARSHQAPVGEDK